MTREKQAELFEELESFGIKFNYVSRALGWNGHDVYNYKQGLSFLPDERLDELKEYLSSLAKAINEFVKKY